MSGVCNSCVKLFMVSMFVDQSVFWKVEIKIDSG